MFRITFVITVLFFHFFPTVSLAQGLEFPDFTAGQHSYVLAFTGSPPPSDPSVEEQLASLPEPVYLVEVWPGFRSQFDADWWSGRLLQQWKSQGFRDEWAVAVVGHSPHILTLHVKATATKAAVLERLEALSSHQHYGQLVEEKENAEAELGKLSAKQAVVETEIAKLTRTLAEEQSQGERLKHSLAQRWWLVGGLSALLLIMFLSMMLREVKRRRQEKKFFFGALSQKKVFLSGYTHFGYKTVTGRTVQTLLTSIETVQKNFAWSESWINQCFDVLREIKAVEEKLNHVKAIDVAGVEKFAYGPLIEHDIPFHEEKWKIEADPLDFNTEVWLSIEAAYSSIQSSISKLGKMRTDELIRKFYRNVAGVVEPGIADVAAHLTANMLVEKHH